MRNRLWTVATLALTMVILTNYCATIKPEAKLDPLSEDFYSKVRYIIAREESKIFLELPPEARAAFIDEFWKRRDPTPGTERNEYMESYFDRIEEANRLFKGGGRSGWLQDRGRIYILFGPPQERQTNPMGGRPIDPYEEPRKMVESQRVATGEKPTEVWVYYNLFSTLQKPQAVTLVFVDVDGTGDYRLTTNIDEVIPGKIGADAAFRPDLVFTHELHKEEAGRAYLRVQKALFDFSWEFVKERDKKAGRNLTIRTLLPYKKIIFIKENGRFKAEMRWEVRIKNAKDDTVWTYEEENKLDFNQEFLDENKESSWEKVILVMTWLEKGKYSVYLWLKNTSGDQEIKKLLSLKM